MSLQTLRFQLAITRFISIAFVTYVLLLFLKCVLKTFTCGTQIGMLPGHSAALLHNLIIDSIPFDYFNF